MKKAREDRGLSTQPIILPAQNWNKSTYQLKLGNVTFPPQIRPHLGTNCRQTIISIHNHVNKTVACCTKVGWKEGENSNFVKNGKTFNYANTSNTGFVKTHLREREYTYRHHL